MYICWQESMPILHKLDRWVLAKIAYLRTKVSGRFDISIFLIIFASRNCVFTQSEEKREQEMRSLKSINDSFRKFVITEDLISRYQDNEGITYMNIYEFLLDENSLRI